VLRLKSNNSDNGDIISAFLNKTQPHQPDPENISSTLENYKSGYVAVVGKPNVGKSTLVNALIGHKVAIVTPKPQTTRQRILGILSQPNMQMLFVDTPGVHMHKHALNKMMMREVDEALADCDVIMFVVDVSHSPTDDDKNVAQRILQACKANVSLSVVLALNKADRVDPRYLVNNVAQYEALIQTHKLCVSMLCSGTRGDNLEKLTRLLFDALPHGPQYYPTEQFTDQTERVIVAELIREQGMLILQQEMPHVLAVVVDEFAERKKGATYIAATLYVERESQKRILIGSNGSMLKRIGAGARRVIEKELGRKVFLELWVKVRDQWRSDEQSVNQFMETN
jgi:GTP-binding protein Era